MPRLAQWSLLVISSLALSLLLLAGCSQKPGPEVWVIGLDGADWDQLNPMIARGELPHLAALRQGGASGTLRSEKPLISPVIWTTIATGKAPDKHGVTWFMTDNADGTKTPVSSNQRQVRSFWNIASEAGLSSGVVGWWATWPADPIDGFVVSDYVGWHSFGVSGHNGSDAGKTWPTGLITTVNQVMPAPAAVSTSLLAGMVNLPPARLAHDATADPYSDPLSHLRQAIATSRGYTNLVLNRLDNERPELLAVYYEGTDAVSHLFGNHQAPKLPWISPADYDAYHLVVERYWQWQDKLLGELLAKRGPETTVVVVSDHGFRVGAERRKEDAFNIETADADHMFDGVIIINGPDVQPGTELQGADIYDVAPTVLYALGLPVASDFAGRVLTAALAPGVVASAPIHSVVTYETSPMKRQQGLAQPAGATEGLEKMLRSLGYIAGTNGDHEHTGQTHTAPEEVVNLATVLMHQGRYEEAIAALRPVAASNPELMEVRLNLAQALARSGQPEQTDEGEQIYRDLLADHPNRLEIYEDLTTVLINGGRYDEALSVYNQGLMLAPRWVNGMAGKGQVLLGLHRNTEAESVLREALQENPRHSRVNLAYGQLLFQAQRVAESLPYLKTAVNLEPENADAALSLAFALQKMGRTKAALLVLQKCLDTGQQRPELLAEKGALLLHLNQAQDAVAPLQMAWQLGGDNIMVMGNLGLALAIDGDLPAAISVFEKIVALQPELADGHAQLGAMYAQLGNMGKAEKALKRALKSDPANAAILVNLGQVHMMKNQQQEARQDFLAALKVDPQYVPALYQLGAWEDRAGNHQEAARLRHQAQQYENGSHTGS